MFYTVNTCGLNASTAGRMEAVGEEAQVAQAGRARSRWGVWARRDVGGDGRGEASSHLRASICRGVVQLGLLAGDSSCPADVPME